MCPTGVPERFGGNCIGKLARMRPLVWDGLGQVDHLLLGSHSEPACPEVWQRDLANSSGGAHRST